MYGYWELDHKEGWAVKNWCFWSMVLEKTLESPLDSKKIKPVNPKGNKPWIFTGRTAAEAEAPILWPPHVKNQLIGKDCDVGKDWRQKEKGVAEGVSITNSMDMNKFWEMVEDRGAWHEFHEVTESDITKGLNSNSNSQYTNLILPSKLCSTGEKTASWTN